MLFFSAILSISDGIYICISGLDLLILEIKKTNLIILCFMLQFDRRSFDNVRVLRCNVGESKRRQDSVVDTFRKRENASSVESQRRPNLII